MLVEHSTTQDAFWILIFIVQVYINWKLQRERLSSDIILFKIKTCKYKKVRHYITSLGFYYIF